MTAMALPNIESVILKVGSSQEGGGAGRAPKAATRNKDVHEYSARQACPIRIDFVIVLPKMYIRHLLNVHCRVH
jgi:hypothetical protein